MRIKMSKTVLAISIGLFILSSASWFGYAKSLERVQSIYGELEETRAAYDACVKR